MNFLELRGFCSLIALATCVIIYVTSWMLDFHSQIKKSQDSKRWKDLAEHKEKHIQDLQSEIESLKSNNPYR